jgi:hypothetical protein
MVWKFIRVARLVEPSLFPSPGQQQLRNIIYTNTSATQASSLLIFIFYPCSGLSLGFRSLYLYIWTLSRQNTLKSTQLICHLEGLGRQGLQLLLTKSSHDGNLIVFVCVYVCATSFGRLPCKFLGLLCSLSYMLMKTKWPCTRVTARGVAYEHLLRRLRGKRQEGPSET